MSKSKQNFLGPWDSFDDIIYIRDCFYGSEPRFDEGIAKVSTIVGFGKSKRIKYLII